MREPRGADARVVPGLVVLAAAVAALVGVGLLSGPATSPRPPSAPARVGPYTHRLYVVDATSDAHVVALDTRGGAIETVHSYAVGGQAEVALSPDGARLYALAFRPGRARQTLSTFDTRTTRITDEAPIESLLPEGWNTEQYQSTCCTGLYSSPDGGRLYFTERSYTRRHAADGIWIGTFDTVAGRLLPEAAEISGCDRRTIVALANATIVVVCSHSNCCQAYSQTNDVRWLTIAADGSTEESHVVPLTPPSTGTSADVSGELAWAVASPDRRWIYAVTRTGLLFVIDVRAETVKRVVQLDLAGSFEVTGEKVALSPDGSMLFVGASDADLVTAGLASSIQRFDVASWRRTGRVRAAAPFYSLAFGPKDDGRLYVFSPGGTSAWVGPRTPSVEVLDPASLRQVDAVMPPFEAPILGMVPALDRR